MPIPTAITWCWPRSAATTAACFRTRSICSTCITNMPTCSRPTRSLRISTGSKCARPAEMKPRDYGPFDYSPIINRPRLTWPKGERLALWVIPNIEFFSLQERPGGYGAGGKTPDVVMWSDRDYGNRIGVWRLMDVLERYGIRGTVALNSDLCQHHPVIIEEGNKRRWE